MVVPENGVEPSENSLQQIQEVLSTLDEVQDMDGILAVHLSMNCPPPPHTQPLPRNFFQCFQQASTATCQLLHSEESATFFP